MRAKPTRRDFLHLMSISAASSVMAVTFPAALRAAPVGVSRKSQAAVEQFVISADQLNQAVYVAIAAGADDPQLDILAGVTYFLLKRHPNLPSGEIQTAIETVQQAISTSTTDPIVDLGGDDTINMSRILTQLVPNVTDNRLKKAIQAYTLAFLRSFRRNVDPFRQVATIDTQFDQFIEVNRFRRDAWENLHRFAIAHPQASTAIDQSPIATALGIQLNQDAAAMLAAVPMQPLSDFIAAHGQADGGVQTELAEVEALLEQLSTSTLELSDGYTQNLIEINVVEQQTRNAALPWKTGVAAASVQEDGEGEEEEKTELEKAIEKAEKLQKEWDSIFKDVHKGAKTTFDVLAFLVKQDDPDFAADIKKFAEISLSTLDMARKYSKTAISTAKALAGFLEVGATGFAILSGIGLGIGLIGIGVHIFGMFGKKNKPNINKKILEGLEKISKQITRQIGQLREEMHLRFDRIEKQLNIVMVTLLEQFARINWELGQLEGNVEEIQSSLYNLHSQLRRVHRDIYTFLEAEGRRDLTTAINGYLNYQQRTGEQLDFQSFAEAENIFFSWGRDHSADPLQAGPVERAFGDDDLLGELTTYPLATNINYLRRFLRERFGLAELAPERLANLSDWTTAAEAYSQLYEEWPQHAAQISPDRTAALMVVGERIAEGLANISNMELMNALAAHYRVQFDELKAAVNGFENEFQDGPEYGLYGIDLWGGAIQIPDQHFLDKPTDFGPCEGNAFPSDAATLSADLTKFNLRGVAPYLVANNLGLGKLQGCISAKWVETDKLCIDPIPPGEFNPKPIPGHCTWHFRLVISISFSYDGNYATSINVPNDITMLRTFDQFELGYQSYDPNDPNDPSYSANFDPYRAAEEGWNEITWTPPAPDPVYDPPVIAPIIPNVEAAEQSAANAWAETIDAVETRLRELQRFFYFRITEKMGDGGDPIQISTDRLTGSKLLWQSYVTLGLPLSLNGNEQLHSLLFGSEAIPGGKDVGGEDLLLDDLHDIYAFFASREEEPPSYNIMEDIEPLVNQRVDNLVATLQSIIEGTDVNGQLLAAATTVQTNRRPEAAELVAPTLLRLSLVDSLEPDTEPEQPEQPEEPEQPGEPEEPGTPEEPEPEEPDTEPEQPEQPEEPEPEEPGTESGGGEKDFMIFIPAVVKE